MSQIPIILKPSLRESDIKTGTAGIEIIITYSGPPTAQEKKQFTADKLLSVIKEMGPSPELANSIKKEMGWRRKVKIRTANL